MNKIKLKLTLSHTNHEYLGGICLGTSIESYYRPGDTASICDCITDFSNKAEGFKGGIKEYFPKSEISYRIQFIRPDGTTIDEIDCNTQELNDLKELINLFNIA